MQHLLCSLLLLCLSLPLSAQFGLSAYYNDAGPAVLFLTDENGTEQEVFPENVYEFGIDYWFRLKNVRVEFLPGLSFASNQLTPEAGPFQSRELAVRQYNAFFQTRIYPFDFYGDCDCPTFSKQGPALARGLFINAGPIVSSQQFRIPDEGGSDYRVTRAGILAGLGFDIGLSDLLTLSPQAGIRTYFGDPDSGVPGQQDGSSRRSSLRYFAGIRLGLRLDQ